MHNNTTEQIKDLIKNNAFFNLRNPLEKISNIWSVDFATSPISYYSFICNDTNKKYLITHKNNVELDGTEILINDFVLWQY